jgi:hypothetical protein
MRVQDLQQFLGSFTEGSDAVKNAVIFVELNGKLHAIRRMEVHENVQPNYIKNLKKISLQYRGSDLKILAYPVLLIYWAIIILGTFSQ